MFGKAFMDEGYVVFNKAHHNQLVQTAPSDAGDSLEQRDAEAIRWIDSILNDTDPLVNQSKH